MVFCIASSWLQSRFWINLEKNLTVRQSYSTHMPKRWAPNSHSNQVQLEEIVGRRGKEPGKHPPMFRHILGSHQPLWKCSIPLHLTVTMWKRLAFQTTTENPWTSIRKILECVCYRQKKKFSDCGSCQTILATNWTVSLMQDLTPAIRSCDGKSFF